jgi:signal transduction histidine kinase
MSASADNGRSDILVVDDDARNRRLLEGYLLAEGYGVRSAADGAEALRLAEEKAPDIVLLDVMMPGMSGFQVCETLKEHPGTRLTQVVLVTALDGTPNRVEGLDHGADDYLTKPVRREEFMAKIRSLLRARKLMTELEEARATLAERNAQLIELEALKETLTQTLVHDLKNPLAALAGNLELLGLVRDDKIATRVARCKASASRMHRMILDLMDVARLEEGRFVLQPEPVETADVARAAVAEAEVAAAHRGVSIEVVPPPHECTAWADPSIVRRILDNLVANALAHSPAGSSVRVGVSCREEGIELSVADQGSGIPEEHRERVFDKYTRLELREAGITANRGLGLTFCRLATEAHGGTIWVDEAPGGGALFRVLLPAHESAEPREAAHGEVLSPRVKSLPST